MFTECRNASYDNKDDKTQTFYVDFKHGIQPVGPEDQKNPNQKPGKPGDPINPDDPDKNKSPKYPVGSDVVTKDVTENITYEGYGVGGVAVMVECMTDNHNRTASDVRHAFTKFGGNLGTSGSVGYLFTRKGVISFAPDEDGKMNIDEEKAMEIGLEAGADDIVTNDDGSIDVYTTPEAFADVVEAFEKNNIKPVNAEVSMVPSTESELEGDQAVKCMRMIDALEDLDDVQNVYHNASFPDDLEI